MRRPGFLQLGKFAGAALLVLLAVASGCGERDSLRDALPPSPDLSSAPPALIERVDRAVAGVESGNRTAASSFKELTLLYHANGHLFEAIHGYDVLLRLEPNEPRWPHLLAFILAGYGELDAAIPLWDEVIRLDPAYLPAQVRRADALLKQNLPTEAEAAYNQILERNPRDAYGLLGLGRLALTRGDYNGARRHLEAASASSSGRIGTDLLVTVYEQLGLHQQALDLRAQSKAAGSYSDVPDPWLSELMEYCYDAYQLVSAGGFAAFSGDPERGIGLLKRALLLKPDDAIAHFQLADLYAQKRDTRQALHHYRESRKARSNFADAWLKEVLLLREMGHEEQAEQLFYEALVANPQSPGMQLEHGILLYRQGRHREAVGALQKSIRLRPNEPYAYMQLAAVYLQLEMLDEAIDQAELALRAEPGYTGALISLATIYIGTGDRENADRIMDMVRLQPRISPVEVRKLTANYNVTFGAR